MENLEGRVAVVTGAASGIGRAMAECFAGAGMRLVLADVEEPPLRAFADELGAAGTETLAVPTDVSKEAAMDALAAAAFDRFGTVHVVCNNAGVGGGGPTAQLTTRTWEWVLGVNLWGVIHGHRVFLPRLLEQDEGHLVNTASIAGFTSFPNMAPYNVSKHAVVTLSETVHQELIQSGSRVGVSVLCPGFVATRILESERNRPEQLMDGHERTEEAEQVRQMAIELYKAQMPPSEVAELVRAAILATRFYVFTDHVFDELIARRHAAIQDRRNPDSVGELWQQLFR